MVCDQGTLAQGRPRHLIVKALRGARKAQCGLRGHELVVQCLVSWIVHLSASRDLIVFLPPSPRPGTAQVLNKTVTGKGSDKHKMRECARSTQRCICPSRGPGEASLKAAVCQLLEPRERSRLPLENSEPMGKQGRRT